MDTLTRMRAFVAVAEAGGYSAAGRKIGRSKALLSKYVRELEDELGALLLNRTTRQISLTEAGEVYLTRAIEIIGEIDGLGDAMRDRSAAAGGRIRLSAPRAFADSALGRVLVEFSLAHTDIELDIDLSDRFVDLVEEGYDLAIRITTPEDSELIFRHLAPMRLVTVGSPELIERIGTPTAPEDLANMPCVIDLNSKRARQWRFRAANGEALSVTVGTARFSANSPVMAMEAARGGLGFASVPDFVVEEACSRGDLVEVLEPWAWRGSAIHVLYPHRRHMTRRVRLLLDFLATWFAEREARGGSPIQRGGEGE